jgi:hypothetical protein
MAEDRYSADYQRHRDSAHLQAWRSLNECEEILCRANAFDPFGPAIYNSLGGMAEGWGLSSRIARVRDALDRAQPQAWQHISDRFANLNIGIIWPILINLASDIALYVGGGAASGAALGAAVGFFFGGIGAVPGALAGASIGTSAGIGLLNWIGLASLAKDLAQAIPQAIGCYIDGIKTAWGPEPERNWRSGGFSAVSATASGSDSQLVFQASHQIAQGHVVLIGAILMAIMAYVTRGKGDKAALLTEMRNSPRLGPKMADWVQANEAQFPQAMAAMESRAAGKGGGGTKAASEAQAPAQAAGKAKEEPATNKTKALTGEAAGRDYMQKNGFEKISGDKGWNAPGTDDIWKNAKPPPDYVVTEYKYGQGSLGSTKDGLQMSDDWLNGVNTGRDRVKAALSETDEKSIRQAMKNGGVEKWLLQVDDAGSVTKQVLDGAGKVLKGP